MARQAPLGSDAVMRIDRPDGIVSGITPSTINACESVAVPVTRVVRDGN